jgi:hypothetical protein
MRIKVEGKTLSPYAVMLAVNGLLLAAAFVVARPATIWTGLARILASRSVLLTDYVYVGGLGAALVNASLVGVSAVAALALNRVKPSGSAIMAMCLSTGFAFFGKNLFNMLPITLGVYLYSRFQREPFSNYTLVSLMASTLAPVVSGIAFFDALPAGTRVLYGILLGVLVGFVFPAITTTTARAHNGYCLYNMGMAGGLIATFLVAAFSSAGIKMEPELHWSNSNTALTGLLYLMFAGLVAAGIVGKGGLSRAKEDFAMLLTHSGRAPTDYYEMYGRAAYLNMGIAGAFATSVMLLMGCELNGPTVGGIFTIVGFSAYGKHLRNITPPIAGAMAAAYVNTWNPTMPSNTVAILFSSGLAPISGEFGWAFGVLAGVMHVTTTIHLSSLNGGYNLYNNGFAACFVAFLLVPLIKAWQKRPRPTLSRQAEEKTKGFDNPEVSC